MLIIIINNMISNNKFKIQKIKAIVMITIMLSEILTTEQTNKINKNH